MVSINAESPEQKAKATCCLDLETNSRHQLPTLLGATRVRRTRRWRGLRPRATPFEGLHFGSSSETPITLKASKRQTLCLVYLCLRHSGFLLCGKTTPPPYTPACTHTHTGVLAAGVPVSLGLPLECHSVGFYPGLWQSFEGHILPTWSLQPHLVSRIGSPILHVCSWVRGAHKCRLSSPNGPCSKVLWDWPCGCFL